MRVVWTERVDAMSKDTKGDGMHTAVRIKTWIAIKAKTRAGVNDRRQLSIVGVNVVSCNLMVVYRGICEEEMFLQVLARGRPLSGQGGKGCTVEGLERNKEGAKYGVTG